MDCDWKDESSSIAPKPSIEGWDLIPSDPCRQLSSSANHLPALMLKIQTAANQSLETRRRHHIRFIVPDLLLAACSYAYMGSDLTPANVRVCFYLQACCLFFG